MTQKELLKKLLRSYYIQDPTQWIKGFDLDKRWFEGEWLSHKTSCRARECAAAGEIERSYDEAGYAQYRYLPSKFEQQIAEEKEQIKLTRLENQLKLNI